jgi:hypothetical protein
MCRDAFLNYWINGNMLTLDLATQIFTILKQPDLKYLTQVEVFVCVRIIISGSCCHWIAAVSGVIHYCDYCFTSCLK